MMAEGHFFRQGLTACCKPFGSGLAHNTMASERPLHVFNAFSLLEGCMEQENNAHKNERANFCFFLCFSPLYCLSLLKPLCSESEHEDLAYFVLKADYNWPHNCCF